MKSMFSAFVSEFVGTALLLSVGLSVVIFNWGDGSIVASLIPSVELRRAVTGFLFGTTGCLITLSPIGKISGAHINPAMSFAFWLRGKMRTNAMIGYIFSQMLGAAAGSLPLLLWKQQGRSIYYGATLVSSAGIKAAFFGELWTTAGLIITVFLFVGSKKLRNYTPFTMPVLYAFMVWAETAYSGCSTNPARSFGPAFASNYYTNYWLYAIAPMLSAAIVVGIFKLFRINEYFKIMAARISYHNNTGQRFLLPK